MKLPKQKGLKAEEIASEYLIKNGYKILERNYYTCFGEIDIIASKDGVLRFFEVKSGTKFEPILNISNSKLQKIIKSAHLFLSQKGLDGPYSIDAIILKDDKIEILENITI